MFIRVTGSPFGMRIRICSLEKYRGAKSFCWLYSDSTYCNRNFLWTLKLNIFLKNYKNITKSKWLNYDLRRACHRREPCTGCRHSGAASGSSWVEWRLPCSRPPQIPARVILLKWLSHERWHQVHLGWDDASLVLANLKYLPIYYY